MLFKKKSVNFLIIDDHPLICAALSHIFEKQPYVQSIQEAQSSADAMKIIREGSVDFLILDIDLVNSDGFELLRRARAFGYAGHVLFVSAHSNMLYSQTAQELGANGYLTKGEDLSMVKEAVEGILKGYTIFKSHSPANNEKPKVKLSKREVVVFNYLIKGYSNKDIADFLSLSNKTVSTYKTRIFEKYQVKSVVDLIKVKELII